ncbi:hypothetical protein EDB85DRAFT_2147731 [Lactarius pseudohatsudake]|nr:hypothetical protein EDB85DRAFT_2147731 [Lactarius pseudohatsudake]
MTLLMLVLSVTATPLKQAKIIRGGIGGRDDDHGEHKPNPTPTHHYPHAEKPPPTTSCNDY